MIVQMCVKIVCGGKEEKKKKHPVPDREWADISCYTYGKIYIERIRYEI